jgi:hypothetical protein
MINTFFLTQSIYPYMIEDSPPWDESQPDDMEQVLSSEPTTENLERKRNEPCHTTMN